MPDDLVAFLRARLDEDEKTAREATADTTGQWTLLESSHGLGLIVRDADGSMIVPARWAEDRQMGHVARHDPARVLRGVESKRHLLATLRPGSPVLSILAYEWSDHPDYDREHWATETDLNP